MIIQMLEVKKLIYLYTLKAQVICTIIYMSLKIWMIIHMKGKK